MVSSLREGFIQHLTLRGLSPKTITGYVNAVRDLSLFYSQSPDLLSNSQIHDFLANLIVVEGRAWSSVNVFFSAYKCFYREYLGWDRIKFHIPKRGRITKRPTFLSKSEVGKLLRATSSLKHQAVLATAYGGGLRVSEVCHLKPHHIESDPERMMIRVDQGKGRKDRYTILPEWLLNLLRQYWLNARPKNWLFFGRDRDQALPVGTAQKIFYTAKEKAGITRPGGIHILRHSFATHMLEQKVDLFILKRWLGHRSLSTTAAYLHVTAQMRADVMSPLDLFDQ